jgi:disulfide bond formation protein DsbB
MAQLYLLAATLNVWVLVAVLAAAFGVQLWLGEPPCPLCVMQRTALMLTGLGPLHILLQARSGALTARVAAVGQGMAIIAAVLGAMIAARQIFLHILPGDPGFGSPILGLHLYTWCFIAFACQIAASAVLLIATNWLEDSKVHWPATPLTVGVFTVIVAANLLSVIAEAGLHWDLPSDPVSYLLFK